MITEARPGGGVLIGNTIVFANPADAAAFVASLDFSGVAQPISAVLTALAAGSQYVKFVGPTTTVKTFTLPDADATIVTPSAAQALTNKSINGVTLAGSGTLTVGAGGTLGTGAFATISSYALTSSLGTGAFAAIADYALLAAPAFSGAPTAPTAAQGTNSTQLATTAFVHGEIAVLTNLAPSVLDTFKEVADQLAADESGAAALVTTVAGKQASSATLTALAAGSAFVQFTGPSSSVKVFTLPNAAGTIAVLDATQTLTNKTISGASNTLTVRLANDVTGILSTAHGGTGSATPGITAGGNIVINGSWPNQQVSTADAGGPGVYKSVTINQESYAGHPGDCLVLNGQASDASAPVLAATQAWNDGGVDFTLITADVTNITSGAGSKLLDLKVGGVSKFAVDPSGNITVGGSGTTQLPTWQFQAGGGFTPTTGNFITDDATIAATTAIILSESVWGEFGALSSGAGSLLVLTSAAGAVSLFTISSVANNYGGSFVVSFASGESGSWATGNYAVSFIPGSGGGGGGGSPQSLSDVLGVGADGGAVDQSNLGTLGLASGKVLQIGGVQVVGAQVAFFGSTLPNPGSPLGGDTVDLYSLSSTLTDHATAINDIRALLKTHGLMASS